MRIAPFPLPDGMAAWLRQPHRGSSLFWLGQAGFGLRLDDAVLLIDPYLSDHLANKYRGTRFGHERLMPAPLAPDALPRLDLVLCTHRHGDHMDPGTLPVLARCHPRCRFVVPAPEQPHALALELPADRILPAEAHEPLDLPLDAGAASPALRVVPLPAAHESFERDAAGRHRFLGFVLDRAGLRLYHSGDSIPFPGLAAALRPLAPALALLPVNGRDPERAAAGVPGNFTLDEAVALCDAAAIPHLVPHHWGMFAFNTADPAAIAARTRDHAAAPRPPAILLPDPRSAWRLHPDP